MGFGHYLGVVNVTGGTDMAGQAHGMFNPDEGIVILGFRELIRLVLSVAIAIQAKS